MQNHQDNPFFQLTKPGTIIIIRSPKDSLQCRCKQVKTDRQYTMFEGQGYMAIQEKEDFLQMYPNVRAPLAHKCILLQAD